MSMCDIFGVDHIWLQSDAAFVYPRLHRGETIYRVLAWKLRGRLEVDSIHSVVIGQQR